MGESRSGATALGAGYLYTLPFLTPLPSIALLSPSGTGIGAVVEGVVPVIGAVQGDHLLEWRLDVAPGRNAVSGFALISSGTVAVSSGTLGIWNASSLSGFQTLRLLAKDTFGNTAAALACVFVGDPAVLLSIPDLKKPHGVAVGADGTIYVADRDHDRIVALSSAGFVIGVIGDRGSTRLSKPSALAVDASGNVYAADTGNGRALKLSPSGQTLMQISSLDQPRGIALDESGNIYVSDSGAGAVRKFGPSGSLLLAFPLPDLPDKKSDKKQGEPAGIAIDAARRLYVADSEGNRILVFDASAILIGNIGSKGSAPGQLEAPEAVAVNSGGDWILVSDAGNDRVQKFDRSGNVIAGFGGRRLLNKPRGLALDAAEALYVADSQNDRVEKFGPPAAAPLAAALSAQESALSAEAPAEFIFRDLYVFPNPAHRAERPIIRLQTGLADSVSIEIYDVSGQVVHRAEAVGPRVIDDGNGKGRQYTYDYPWDTGRVGSGVYLCLVTAKKIGHGAIKKITKAAVIK